MFISFVSIERGIDSAAKIALAFKFVAEIFGIIAGIIGIYLSRANKDTKMKCLWKGFIPIYVLVKNFDNTSL